MSTRWAPRSSLPAAGPSDSPSSICNQRTPRTSVASLPGIGHEAVQHTCSKRVLTSARNLRGSITIDPTAPVVLSNMQPKGAVSSRISSLYFGHSCFLSGIHAATQVDVYLISDVCRHALRLGIAAFFERCGEATEDPQNPLGRTSPDLPLLDWPRCGEVTSITVPEVGVRATSRPRNPASAGGRRISRRTAHGRATGASRSSSPGTHRFYLRPNIRDGVCRPCISGLIWIDTGQVLQLEL